LTITEYAVVKDRCDVTASSDVDAAEVIANALRSPRTFFALWSTQWQVMPYDATDDAAPPLGTRYIF
jgi:hypothetical protein